LKLTKVVCLIQGVVSPNCGDKRMARDILCRTTLLWRHIIGMREKPHQCKQSDRLIFIHLYYESRIHGYILISKDIVSIFSTTVRSTFL